MKKTTVMITAILICAALFFGCAAEEPAEDPEPEVYDDPSDEPVDLKPVIYLYPEEKTDVSVKLDYDGILTLTYPEYCDGWSVTAYPDGRLIDKADGKEYSYLFWEGVTDTDYTFDEGYVVKGVDTADFLREKLSAMGLEPREYNEFIVYWLPRMQGNAYNLISFQEEAYTGHAALNITPEPDSVLRVFMAFKPLDDPVEIDAPEIAPFERKGFTVVEWGGTECE